MNYRDKIIELFQTLQKSDDKSEQLSAKSEILKIAYNILELPEDVKLVTIQGYSNDIDNYINSTTKHLIKDNTMIVLKDSLLKNLSH